MINYLPQPIDTELRKLTTQQTKQYKLTKQRNLPMITELIITDKDVRGKYRNHEYSQQQ